MKIATTTNFQEEDTLSLQVDFSRGWFRLFYQPYRVTNERQP
jgi:hypothetical protein